MDKLVSVILPVFNGGRFLSEAIDSVFEQNYPQLEIIVIDDGSTDNTKEVVASYGDTISYFYQENGGPAKARNLGLSKASGSFVAFIDADDIWVKNKLEMQLAQFEKNKSIGVVIGLTLKARFLNKEELITSSLNRSVIFQLLLGSSLIRKAVFEQIGGLDEDLFIGDDTDWFNRVKENRIPIAVLREVVQYYRIHEDNITNDKKRFNFFVFKLLQKTKDRKRNPDFKPLPATPKINTMDDLINYWHSAG